MALKQRQRDILHALRKLGGEATTREIAKKADMNVNGVAQSLGAMHKHINCLGGRGCETRWSIIEQALPLFSSQK